MTIDTSTYYYNAANHTAIAEEINALAAVKNVQVSRWVNNSKGRQIVTYIVHEGERNQFASKQENVLFQIGEDAGRGGKIYDETAMLAEVREFLSAMVEPTPEPETFVVTTDLFGNSENASFEQIENIVRDMLDDAGWTFTTERRGDEIRVYAEQADEDAESLPAYWTMMNNSQGFLRVAELVTV